MKYGILFLLLALTLAMSAMTGDGGRLTLLYPALSFGVVATAYLGAGPKVFGKRADGRIPLLHTLILLPYLLGVAAVWHLIRLLSSEPRMHRLSDDVILSRRLLNGELPAGVASVVDLTCEFVEPSALRRVQCYRCFAMLDGSTRSGDEIRQLACEIGEMPKPVLIHCAQGHGRTGLIAAALLLSRGQANSVEQAIEMVKTVRPGVSLNRDQLRVLGELA